MNRSLFLVAVAISLGLATLICTAGEPDLRRARWCRGRCSYQDEQGHPPDKVLVNTPSNVASANGTKSEERSDASNLSLGLPAAYQDAGAATTPLEASVHSGEVSLNELKPSSEESSRFSKRIKAAIILVSYSGAEPGPQNEKPHFRSKNDAFALAKQVSELAKTDIKGAASKGDTGSSETPLSFERGWLEASVESILFSLGPGEVSEPIDTPRGFWVAKRTE